MKAARIFLVLLILPLMLSCIMYSTPPLGETNFPLEQVAKFPIDGNIHAIAVSDNWIAAHAINKITGIDATSQETLWNIELDLFSKANGFQMIDDNLVAASSDRVILLNKFGQVRDISLEPGRGYIIDLAGVYPNYVYAMRGNWILEAYDIPANRLIWKMPLGRGVPAVHLDASSNIADVVTYGSTRAVDNLTGSVLWEREGGALNSAYEDGILYSYRVMNGKDNYRLAAIDLQSQNELWGLDMVFPPAGGVNELTVIGNLLIASGGPGLIALDKSTGEKIWETALGEHIYTSPVEFEGVLYAKDGGSRTVYAISLQDGSILGTANLEPDSMLSLEDTGTGVYRLKDGIVFNTKDAVVIYKHK
jgi:outer membrane protein assembly factor BamB